MAFDAFYLKAVLDEIVKLCQERDIEIIFYTVPYEGSYGSSAEMKEYAEENGCAYINFFEKIYFSLLNSCFVCCIIIL